MDLAADKWDVEPVEAGAAAATVVGCLQLGTLAAAVQRLAAGMPAAGTLAADTAASDNHSIKIRIMNIYQILVQI